MPGAFALLVIALFLLMFGGYVYLLQVPAALQSRWASASDRRSAGKLVGVFIMDAISAPIVRPRVAVRLAGALLYIGRTYDGFVGGSALALFATAVGMGVPPLLVGISASALLPRAGAWMQAVKFFFGVLSLAWRFGSPRPPLPVGCR